MLRWIGADQLDSFREAQPEIEDLKGPRQALWTVSRPPSSGCVVALVALPARWAAAWPELPEPLALQMVAVSADGLKPYRDDKRPFGFTRGGVVLVGAPDHGTMRSAEGLADALALAARNADGGPGISLLGTSGFTNPDIADWIAL